MLGRTNITLLVLLSRGGCSSPVRCLVQQPTWPDVGCSITHGTTSCLSSSA